MLNRREVLSLAAAVGAAAVLAESGAADQGADMTVLDTNVSLFRWPFRRLPLDKSEALTARLEALGIQTALAGSFEGVLHRDVASVNQRLAAECRKSAVLVPVGTVNPEQPGWEEELRRCVETHHMPGIRLHPNYHGYTLEDPRVGELLARATTVGLFVQIAVSMEDNRTQHPLMQVPDVVLEPLQELVPRIPGVRVQLLNHRLRGPLLERLGQTQGVYFDTARIDGTDGIPNLVQSVRAGAVLSGSHAPFMIPEAALIRTHESSRLSISELRAVLGGNAEQFLKGSQP